MPMQLTVTVCQLADACCSPQLYHHYHYYYHYYYYRYYYHYYYHYYFYYYYLHLCPGAQWKATSEKGNRSTTHEFIHY